MDFWIIQIIVFATVYAKFICDTDSKFDLI